MIERRKTRSTRQAQSKKLLWKAREKNVVSAGVYLKKKKKWGLTRQAQNLKERGAKPRQK
jgi:hypothetical protein